MLHLKDTLTLIPCVILCVFENLALAKAAGKNTMMIAALALQSRVENNRLADQSASVFCFPNVKAVIIIVNFSLCG